VQNDGGNEIEPSSTFVMMRY